MSESLQSQLEAIRGELPKSKEKSATPLDAAPEGSLEAPNPALAGPVESAAVHSRGGEVVDSVIERKKRSRKDAKAEYQSVEVPEKGDVYFTAKGERIVVEGIRKAGEETIVLFSYELKTDVPKEPGENLRQLSLANFEVMRQTGGYTELKPIYKERLNQVAEEFQQAWNASVDVLNQIEDIEIESEEAAKEAEASIEVLQAIGRLEDEWDALGEEESRKKLKGAVALLERLKAMVGQLPESLVASNSLLVEIHREYASKVGAEEEAEENEGQNRVARKKRSKVTDAAEKGEGKRRGANQHRGRGGRGDAMIEGAAGVGQSERDKALVEGEGRNAEAELLNDWISDINEQQQALKQMALEMEDRGLVDIWRRAMLALDKERKYERFARSRTVDTIAGELADIKRAYKSWDRKAGSIEDWVQEKTRLLQLYSQMYADILESGKRVLVENKGALGKDRARGNRRADRYSARNRAERGSKTPSGDLIVFRDSSQWEQVPVPIQQVVLADMRRLAGTMEDRVDALDARLEPRVTDEERRRLLVFQTLAPVFNEEVAARLKHIGVEVPQELVDRTAGNLLENAQKPSYGGEGE